MSSCPQGCPASLLASWRGLMYFGTMSHHDVICTWIDFPFHTLLIPPGLPEFHFINHPLTNLNMESSAIIRWLATHNTSQMTLENMEAEPLIPCKSLKSAIESWRTSAHWSFQLSPIRIMDRVMSSLSLSTQNKGAHHPFRDTTISIQPSYVPHSHSLSWFITQAILHTR